MNIDHDEVLRLERLARVRLSDAERDTVRADLERVLGHFEALAAIDVAGLVPMLRPVHVEDGTREDRVRESLPQESVLASGNARHEGFLRVPRTGGDD